MAHFVSCLIAIIVITSGIEYIFIKVKKGFSKQKMNRFARFILLSIAFVMIFFSIFYFLIVRLLDYTNDLYSFTISTLGTIGLSALFIFINYGKSFTALGKLPEVESHIKVKSGVSTYIIAVTDIYCFALLHKTVFLIAVEGKRIFTNFSLLELEKILDPDLFFRASRQYIIRRDAISTIKPLQNSSVRVWLKEDLGLNNPIVISRYKAAAFKKWFLR